MESSAFPADMGQPQVHQSLYWAVIPLLGWVRAKHGYLTDLTWTTPWIDRSLHFFCKTDRQVRTEHRAPEGSGYRKTPHA